jgi:hypothetical protein
VRTRVWQAEVLGVLVVLLSAAAAAAQGDGRGELRKRGGRDEAGRMVDAYIVSHLQESLDLTDEQFVRAVGPVKRLLDDRRRIFLERRRVLVDLRRALGAQPPSEKEVRAKLGELKRLQDETNQTTSRNVEAVDATLTPLQQARFRLLEVEVEQRIRDMVREHRRLAPAGPREED